MGWVVEGGDRTTQLKTERSQQDNYQNRRTLAVEGVVYRRSCSGGPPLVSEDGRREIPIPLPQWRVLTTWVRGRGKGRRIDQTLEHRPKQ